MLISQARMSSTTKISMLDKWRMAPLWLILMFVLQFEGISGDTVKLYHTPGHDAVLPCHILSSATSTCSTITWFYNSAATKVVADGIVKNDLVRAARLRLDKGCNLFIDSITAEDAGLYVCRKGRATMLDTNVVLSVLTISPSPPDRSGAEVALKCSLLGRTGHRGCGDKRLLWVDEAGTVLSGDGVRSEDTVGGCVSILTVNSGHGRRYTCRLVDESNGNNVQIQADHTLVVTDPPYVAIGAAVGVAVFLLVVAAAAGLIKCRKRTKETDGGERPTKPHDDPEDNLTYITVSHVNQGASAVKLVKEVENVTYSTIKTPVTTDAWYVSIP
ncbi:uncharacterized protein LOC118290322 [Scophthalmus maximus]|uniref:uncharacterized protein LOC118290322 n=1 Tax=Scophthalmus maximus TaxID=52904 RepID=UPI0015E133EC|nr:uncharacterized protein LOC118290322 [Scophthalmus maximus]